MADKEGYTLVMDWNKVALRLRLLWICLVAFSVTCAILGAVDGNCKDGTPAYLYVMCATIILALQIWQLWTACPAFFVARLLFLLNCLIGAAEIFDYFTDGQQIALARVCDDSFHDAWLETFEQARSPITGLVATLHMWGILLACQIASTLLQAFILVYITCENNAENDPKAVAVIANFVGLAGLQTACQDENLVPIITIFRASCIGLPEGLPGLIFQPSLFALTFAHSEQAGREKQLLSLGITWAVAMKNVVGTARALYAVYDGGLTAFGKAFCALAVLYVAGSLTAVVVGVMRVYYAYQCEEHLWNLQGGCVAL